MQIPWAQVQGTRRIERVEDCLVAAQKAVNAIRLINPWLFYSSSLRHLTEDEAAAINRRIQEAQRQMRSMTHTGASGSTATCLLGTFRMKWGTAWLRWKAKHDIGIRCYSQNGMTPDERAKDLGIINRLFGISSEEDAIAKRLSAAMTELEQMLRPQLRPGQGSGPPAWLRRFKSPAAPSGADCCRVVQGRLRRWKVIPRLLIIERRPRPLAPRSTRRHVYHPRGGRRRRSSARRPRIPLAGPPSAASGHRSPRPSAVRPSRRRHPVHGQFGQK